MVYLTCFSLILLFFYVLTLHEIRKTYNKHTNTYLPLDTRHWHSSFMGDDFAVAVYNNI